MVDRKEDQSTQFRETSSGNFEQAKNIATQTQVDPSLADAQTVAQSLGVDLNTGLSQAEAKRRLDKYGPNELASAPPVPKWKKFLEQFKDPLVYLLLAATGISFVAWFIERANAVPGAEGGEALPFDAIVIVLILIVNAVLGYIQESKAEAAVEALSSMTAPQTNVLRDGQIERINTVDVVPGDIIVLAVFAGAGGHNTLHQFAHDGAGFGPDDLRFYGGLHLLHGIALGIADGLHHMGLHQLAAVDHRADGCDHLQVAHLAALPEGAGSQLHRAHAVGGIVFAALDLAGQVNTGCGAQAKGGKVIAKVLFAQPRPHLDHSIP